MNNVRRAQDLIGFLSEFPELQSPELMNRIVEIIAGIEEVLSASDKIAVDFQDGKQWSHTETINILVDLRSQFEHLQSHCAESVEALSRVLAALEESNRNGSYKL